MNKILELAREKLSIPIKGIEEGKSEGGCYYGSIVVGGDNKDFEFRIGYIFFKPNILTLTDSMNNIMERYYSAIEKYENN